MTPPPVIPCGVALILQGRKFLISQRSAGDTFGSFWEFPGGKKEDEETFEECVIREAREELGIQIVIQRKFMEVKKEYEERTLWLNFYICSHVSGDPKPLESQGLRWADVSELRSFRFPPANEPVIECLIKDFGRVG